MVKINNNLKSVDPLVTVAMPIYNAGKYLRPAVLSIMQQTLTDWELYIIDDGSTDDALSYIADVQDSRIIIIKDGQNKGLAARLNEVINLAKGRYFARMDQDDFSYPDRLSKQVDVLEVNLDLDLLATRAIKI
jgi:glycosyltransferase involved in cell wall biosynthesis